MQYVIWNPEKVCEHTNLKTTTYAALQDAEKGGFSISSVVETDDIEALTRAIYNETDIDLCFHKLE